MNNNLKKIQTTFAIFLLILFISFGVADASVARIQNGQVVENNKVWTINFNRDIEFNKVAKQEVKVFDEDKYEVEVNLEVSKDNKSIIVNPPIGGYELGKDYMLVIGKNISSKDYKVLGKEVLMNFSIKENNIQNMMDKLIVLPNESYDVVEANKMIARLEKIPFPILQGLSKDNIKIILSNTNITGVKEYEYLKGVTPRGWEGTGKTWDDIPGAGGNPVVARIGYSEPGEAHGSINLELHETAHAIDAYVFDDISYSEEYEWIWKQEVNKVFGNDPYFVNYPEEYFAETFAMYYINEEQNQNLKDSAPLTYEFIENLQYKIE